MYMHSETSEITLIWLSGQHATPADMSGNFVKHFDGIAV